MNDFTTELKHDADAAMSSAREASLQARTMHARAELMRHMMLTTAKSADRPRVESVRLVVDEWLDAWLCTRATYPYVQHMEALAGACYDALRSPGEEADRRVRETFADLEHACVANGTTLADEMAWRSGCAHGWWADVHPAPDAPEYRPEARRDTPLWQRGCPPHCLG